MVQPLPRHQRQSPGCRHRRHPRRGARQPHGGPGAGGGGRSAPSGCTQVGGAAAAAMYGMSGCCGMAVLQNAPAAAKVQVPATSQHPPPPLSSPLPPPPLFPPSFRYITMDIQH